MKKIASLLLALLLCMALTVPVLAEEPITITLQPQNTQYENYGHAVYRVKAEGSNLHAFWYMEYQGKTYDLSDNTNGIEPWEAYAGETYGAVQEDANTFTFVFGGIEEELSGAEIWCVVEDGHFDTVSQRAIVTVQGGAEPPEILQVPAQVTVNKGEQVDIRCVAKAPEGCQLEYIWYETTTGKLPNIQAMFPEENSDFITPDTSTPGVRYYVCGITTSQGGRAYSSVIPVTVLDKATLPAMEIETKELPDAVVGQEYRAQLKCNDITGVFSTYYNPECPNQMEDAGLSLLHNLLSGTPTKAGTYTITLGVYGDYGEAFIDYTLKVLEAPDATKPSTEADPTETTAPTTDPVEKPADQNQKDPADQDHASFPWWGTALIALGSAGAGVGAAFLLLKKKN